MIDLIGRIDRALARIEAAGRPSAPAPAPGDGRAAALEETHHRLRARIEGAIAQLDRLIASGENG